MTDIEKVLLQQYKSFEEVYSRFDTLETLFRVFRRNFEELQILLSAAQSPTAIKHIWVFDKHNDLMTVLQEITRLVHNFVASAKTVVDHTRIIIHKAYDKTDFLEEYKVEVQKRFLNDPVAGFIEDLRNYCLHYSLPLTSANFVAKRTDVNEPFTAEQTITLRKSQLERWKKWTEKGKPYLAKMDENIPVQPLIEQYYAQVRDFHIWIRTKMEEIHAPAIEVHNALHELYKQQGKFSK